jgi:hypothetical protein
MWCSAKGLRVSGCHPSEGVGTVEDTWELAHSPTRDTFPRPQNPPDLMAICDIIFTVKPAVILETGAPPAP